jgi:3',5'-cyclic AMP phosphodiesterase CpdA
VAVPYARQVRSWLAHRKGAPATTAPYVPFPPGARPRLRIAVAGDVGDRGRGVQKVGAAVVRLARVAEDPWDVLVLLGDAVYPAGNPDRLDATVFGPFGPVLDGGAELLAVLGNHDVKGPRVDELVARLGMPGRWWARRLGDLLLVGLDSTRPGDAVQRAWLEDVLLGAGADARWRVVALHHPPWSAGYQGSALRAREAFVSLFERAGVHLVLSGHEHDYQRSVPLAGVTYVVSGGASRTRRTGEAEFTAVSASWPHFVELAVFDDRLAGRAVGVDGRVGDGWTISA